ncbi:hypothetical protein [Lysinibacillus sp. FSL M8-0355]
MPTYPDSYRIIDEMKNRYPITWLTEMAKVQRSGYYNLVKNRKSIVTSTE